MHGCQSWDVQGTILISYQTLWTLTVRDDVHVGDSGVSGQTLIPRQRRALQNHTNHSRNRRTGEASDSVSFTNSLRQGGTRDKSLLISKSLIRIAYSMFWLDGPYTLHPGLEIADTPIRAISMPWNSPFSMVWSAGNVTVIMRNLPRNLR